MTTGYEDGVVVTDEDRARAADLIQQGWKQVSARHRTLARSTLPPLDAMVSFLPACPAWLREALADTVVRESREHGLRLGREGTESVVLTAGEFKAFKQAGGQTA